MKVIDADGTKKDIDVFFEKKATKGRPRKVLTNEALKLIENLSRILCTDEEIADILNCSRDVFYTEDNAELYRQATKTGQAQGKQSLRRLQYDSAKKGNVRMQIWLGKQWLGQKERIETTTDERLENIIKNVQTVNYLINNPDKDRNIEDFE